MDNESRTSYEGLEEISKITVPEVAWAITLTNKLNEIIERVNILIRLKNGEEK